MRAIWFLPLVLSAAAAFAKASPAEGDPIRGARAYQKCYACHSLEPAKHLTGPSLHAVVGRGIAAEPDFDYSPALRALAVRRHRWTPDLLDRYVADPESIAPRTSMIFHGMPDPQERADLVTYLRNPTNVSSR